MADVSDSALEKETSVSKGLAKRKYILQEEDLQGLEFELKDNPVNKNYGAYLFSPGHRRALF